MADSKLDQALGEIIQNERKDGPRGRNQQRRSVGAPKAPAGGIQKTRAQPHRRVASQPTRVSSWKSDKSEVESKVVVSNLPYDVTEEMIKEYFNETVGNVFSVEIHYGPDGRSRGKADVLFSKAESASLAFAKLDKLPIDSRPIKIEIIGAKAEIPKTKSLSERAGQPKKEKVQPKSAADIKDKSGKGQQAKKTGGAGIRKNPPRRGAAGPATRSARPAKKTAEELDLEMADYFDQANNNGGTDGAVETTDAPAAASGDDAAMDDEIS